LFDVCVELMETIQSIPQPVIAKVHGVATAAGCQLVAACDLAVADERARFATPGVKIGLFCSTPMVPLSRAIGRKRALEMLLTGDFVDAPTALEWGLVNRVVPADGLDDAGTELVERIAHSSPLTVGIGKEAFYARVAIAGGYLWPRQNERNGLLENEVDTAEHEHLRLERNGETPATAPAIRSAQRCCRTAKASATCRCAVRRSASCGTGSSPSTEAA